MLFQILIEKSDAENRPPNGVSNLALDFVIRAIIKKFMTGAADSPAEKVPYRQGIDGRDPCAASRIGLGKVRKSCIPRHPRESP
jgi:hypothetical protein